MAVNCRPVPPLSTNARECEQMSEPQPSRKGPLAAIALIIVLIAGGLWLQRHLRDNARMEDCLMSGRQNCAPIKAAP